MPTSCVQDIFCEFYVYLIKLGKVMKYEAKKMMLIIFLETLNIESGQVDPKGGLRDLTHSHATCMLGNASYVSGLFFATAITFHL